MSDTHLFTFTGAKECHSISRANGKNYRRISKNYTPAKYMQVNRESKRPLMQTNIQKNDERRSKRLRFIECKSSNIFQ
jgi:ribosomal protein L28